MKLSQEETDHIQAAMYMLMIRDLEDSLEKFRKNGEKIVKVVAINTGLQGHEDVLLDCLLTAANDVFTAGIDVAEEYVLMTVPEFMEDA